ncbi:MAG: hypothetical protein ACRD3W_11145 [Terriglobales bacterium]
MANLRELLFQNADPGALNAETGAQSASARKSAGPNSARLSLSGSALKMRGDDLLEEHEDRRRT